MKTKQFNLLITILLFIGLTLSGYAQKRKISKTDSPSPITTISSEDLADQGNIDFTKLFPKQTIGFSVGAGWDSNNDNSQTSICFGAEYLRKFNSKEDCGGYFGGSVSYHTESYDDFKENIFRIGPKFEYHDPITSNGEAQLIYGLKGYYEMGKEDSFGFKQDITGYGATIYSGLNIQLNDKWSLGVEIPIVSYLNRTFKYDDMKVSQDNTSIAINKNSPAMAYGRFSF